MIVTRWEPFREMESLFHQYAPFLSNAPARRTASEVSEWRPLADITETDKEYLIKAQLPDVKKEDVKITVQDGVLTISGERKQVREEKGENEIRVESLYGTFSRSFALPENVEATQVRAETKDGVVVVHVPKKEQRTEKPISVEVK
jgi:HSP20 family protein